jgi:hypothetical protein
MSLSLWKIETGKSAAVDDIGSDLNSGFHVLFVALSHRVAEIIKTTFAVESRVGRPRVIGPADL